MAKVILEGHIIVPAGELEQVLRELPNHIALTRLEAGCLVFTVEQTQDNALRFNVYEEFIDRAAFELHQQRAASSKWGAVTQKVERHYQVNDR